MLFSCVMETCGLHLLGFYQPGTNPCKHLSLGDSLIKRWLPDGGRTIEMSTVKSNHLLEQFSVRAKAEVT